MQTYTLLVYDRYHFICIYTKETYMIVYMHKTQNQHLHRLEDHIIELSALISALQKLDEDDESLIVLLNVLEEKFLNHKASFYAFWHDLSNQNTHHF